MTTFNPAAFVPRATNEDPDVCQMKEMIYMRLKELERMKVNVHDFLGELIAKQIDTKTYPRLPTGIEIEQMIKKKELKKQQRKKRKEKKKQLQQIQLKQKRKQQLAIEKRKKEAANKRKKLKAKQKAYKKRKQLLFAKNEKEKEEKDNGIQLLYEEALNERVKQIQIEKEKQLQIWKLQMEKQKELNDNTINKINKKKRRKRKKRHRHRHRHRHNNNVLLTPEMSSVSPQSIISSPQSTKQLVISDNENQLYDNNNEHLIYDYSDSDSNHDSFAYYLPPGIINLKNTKHMDTNMSNMWLNTNRNDNKYNVENSWKFKQQNESNYEFVDIALYGTTY